MKGMRNVFFTFFSIVNVFLWCGNEDIPDRKCYQVKYTKAYRIDGNDVDEEIESATK